MSSRHGPNNHQPQAAPAVDVRQEAFARLEAELVPVRPGPHEKHGPTISPPQAAANLRLLEAALTSISAERSRARRRSAA